MKQHVPWRTWEKMLQIEYAKARPIKHKGVFATANHPLIISRVCKV